MNSGFSARCYAKISFCIIAWCLLNKPLLKVNFVKLIIGDSYINTGPVIPSNLVNTKDKTQKVLLLLWTVRSGEIWWWWWEWQILHTEGLKNLSLNIPWYIEDAARMVSLCSNVFLRQAALFSPIPLRSCISSTIPGYPMVISSKSLQKTEAYKSDTENSQLSVMTRQVYVLEMK